MKELKDMTPEELRELAEKKEVEAQPGFGNTAPYILGQKYLIRTVTMCYVGQLVAVYENELLLSTVSWVADTDRFSEVFIKGLENLANSEIEPIKGDVIIGRGSIVDCSKYDFDLPTKVK